MVLEPRSLRNAFVDDVFDVKTLLTSTNCFYVKFALDVKNMFVSKWNASIDVKQIVFTFLTKNVWRQWKVVWRRWKIVLASKTQSQSYSKYSWSVYPWSKNRINIWKWSSRKLHFPTDRNQSKQWSVLWHSEFWIRAGLEISNKLEFELIMP